MPIYQYQCDQCHHQMEALQKMSDPKLVDCPECSAPALRKQVTAAAFKLKGTGWYETDFKNSGKAAPAKTSESSSEGAGSSANSPAASGNSPAGSAESASASTASSDSASSKSSSNTQSGAAA